MMPRFRELTKRLQPRRLCKALTLAMAIALVAVASVPSGAQAQSQAGEPAKLTVLLDWFINPDHGPLIIAEEKGIFAKYGLEVEMVEPADPSLPPKLVAAGEADLAVSYQPQLHIQVSEGLPLSRIATLVATPLNTLVVLEDGPIQSLADLKGRKVGFSVGGFEDVILGAMLKTAGLSLDDVELINVNFSLSPSLISGQVDAVIGAFRNFELNQMDIVGRPGRAFFVEEYGVPTYDELIVVAQSGTENDPRFRAFIDAVEEATSYIINHPQETWDIFKATGDSLDDELNKRAWVDTLPRFALRPGALDKARYQKFARFMVESGLAANAPALETYAVELEALE